MCDVHLIRVLSWNSFSLLCIQDFMERVTFILIKFLFSPSYLGKEIFNSINFRMIDKASWNIETTPKSMLFSPNHRTTAKNRMLFPSRTNPLNKFNFIKRIFPTLLKTICKTKMRKKDGNLATRTKKSSSSHYKKILILWNKMMKKNKSYSKGKAKYLSKKIKVVLHPLL